MAHHVLRLTLCRLSWLSLLIPVLENGYWLAGPLLSPTQSSSQSLSAVVAADGMSSKSLGI
jgi:hypothetical protein